MTTLTLEAARPTRTITGRLARLGFWFFLVKGLLWLVAPLLAWLAMG